MNSQKTTFILFVKLKTVQ